MADSGGAILIIGLGILGAALIIKNQGSQASNQPVITNFIPNPISIQNLFASPVIEIDGQNFSNPTTVIFHWTNGWMSGDVTPVSSEQIVINQLTPLVNPQTSDPPPHPTSLPTTVLVSVKTLQGESNLVSVQVTQ